MSKNLTFSEDDLDDMFRYGYSLIFEYEKTEKSLLRMKILKLVKQ